ncbi:hypothetical protein [Trueperella sp. LYQ141]
MRAFLSNLLAGYEELFDERTRFCAQYQSFFARISAYARLSGSGIGL